MLLKNKTIYILSPEPWGISFVSKHHYAVLLSEKGNRVYFINPPSANFKKTVIRENLTVVDYRVGLLRGANRMPGFVRNFINSLLIRNLKNYISEKPDIIWSFDPFRFQNLKLFGANCKIYHPVDVHHTVLEKEVALNSDVIFSTAHKILDRFESVPTPKYFINHGLAEHFLKPQTAITFEPDPEKISVGYIGNLNYQFLDKDILYRILSENNEVDFYFIGPFEKSNLSDNADSDFISKIAGLKNVQLLGPKPSAELPAYLSKFDMLLMCYSGDRNVAEMANPHKILEYLSSGKVALTHYIDEYKDQKELFLMCKKNEELPLKFKEALLNLEKLNNAESEQRRIDFASENTYSKQLERIEKHLGLHCKSL